jgi:alcohol dehydrogenase
MHQILDEMKALKIEKPLVGHTFAFTKLPEAIRLFQSGKTIGKVVVLMNE